MSSPIVHNPRRDGLIAIIACIFATALGVSLCSVEEDIDGFFAYVIGFFVLLVSSFIYWILVFHYAGRSLPSGPLEVILAPLTGVAAFSTWCMVRADGPTLWSYEFLRSAWLWAHGAFHLEMYTGWLQNALQHVTEMMEEKQKKNVTNSYL